MHADGGRCWRCMCPCRCWGSLAFVPPQSCVLARVGGFQVVFLGMNMGLIVTYGVYGFNPKRLDFDVNVTQFVDFFEVCHRAALDRCRSIGVVLFIPRSLRAC